MRRVLVLVVVLLGSAAPAVAQSVVLNPRQVVFTASPDHNTLVGGQPLVVRYDLRHFLVGASSPVTTQDIGKPTPDGSSQCVASITALPLSTTAQYVAKVAAVGPSGEGVSAASSNTYFFVGPPAPGTSVSVR
jgi:hypothetical protein